MFCLVAVGLSCVGGTDYDGDQVDCFKVMKLMKAECWSFCFPPVFT